MILDKPYNKELFDTFLKAFLPDYQKDERPVRTPDSSILTRVTQLGASREVGITVLEAECEETDSKRRIAITQAAFKVLRDHSIRNAIVAFHDCNSQWRLSLLTSTLEIRDGKVVKKDSNPRRYSYLLGVGAKTVTPYKYLVEKGRVENIEQLQERFSVEVVNKQFYASVADLFTKLVGGERGAAKHPGLLKINGIISQNVDHQEFAVRLIGRIIFSWFLKEKKSAAGVPIVPSALLSLDAVASNADYYHSILEPLFFELLNKRVERRHESLREVPFSTVPYLNGGLFSPQYGDFYNQNSFNGAGTPGLTHIPDGWFTELFTILEQYNFTVDENTSYDIDLSIDPEMLGRIFENLLAEINPETGESARKSTGSFYTPREVVDYMVDSSLLEFLMNRSGVGEDKLKALISWGQDDDELHPLTDAEKEKVVNSLAGLTILDPACGSGAFPIGILQKVVYVLQQVDEKAELWLQNQLKTISSPELRRDIEEKYRNENYDYLRKLGVIRESIFGVDIQTIATEISKLRCFLTLIIEEDVDDNAQNRGIRPLPNLDFKFVTANALIGLPASNKAKGLNLFEDASHIDRLKDVRNRYFGADADERARLQVEFKNLQMDMLRSRIATGGATSDLYNTLSDWDPFKHDKTEWFDAEWMFGVAGFSIVIGNPPYGVSIKDDYRRKVNDNLGKVPDFEIYYYFIEAAHRFLLNGGVLAYIVPNTYLFNVFAAKYRLKLLNDWELKLILDCTAFKLFESATVHNTINIFLKNIGAGAPKTTVGYKRTEGARSFAELSSLETSYIDASTLSENNANWGLVFKLSVEILNLVKKIRHAPMRLSELFPEFSQGLIAYDKYKGQSQDIIKNRSYHYSEKIKPELKCWLKGEDVRPYSVVWNGKEYIDYGADIANPREPKFFQNKRLLVREITNPKIYAATTSEELYHDPALIVVLDNDNDITPLLGILNSKLATFYHFNASPKASKGAFPKILVKDIQEFPLPRWDEATELAKLVNARQVSTQAEEQTLLEDQINQLVYKLYNLTPEEIALIEAT